jgi:tetratricopeptide (TPR) repeat protein
MKLPPLVYLILIFCLPVQAQMQRIDSLKNQLALNINKDSLYYNNLIVIALEYRKTDMNSSNEFVQKALAFAEQKSMHSEKAEALNLLGVNKAIQGDFDVAQNYLVEALKVFELTNNKAGQAKILNNLSGVLLNSGNEDKAGLYMDKSIELWLSLGDSSRIADGYVARAILFRSQKKYAEALSYLQRALSIYNKRNDIERIGQVYFNLGCVQKDLNLLADALVSFKKSIAIHNAKAQYHLPELYKLIGEVHTSLSSYDSAQMYLDMALKKAEKQNLKKDKMEIFGALSKLYKARNDYKTSLLYLEQHNEIENEIFDNEKSRQLQELQTRFQTKEKDNQLKLNSYLINKQRIIIGASAIGGVLLIVILVLSLIFYRDKSRSHKALMGLNREIQEKSEEIARQSEELQAMNAEVHAINTNLEKLVKERTEKIHDQNKVLKEYAYMNAHKVRGPLARILGLVNLYKDHQVSVVELFDKVEDSAVELDKVINEINSSLEESDNVEIKDV